MTFDASSEQILTGAADLNLQGGFVMQEGLVSSTGGLVSLEKGGEQSGGSIDVSGSTLKLSDNFSLLELTKSQTAERKGIDNTPSPEHQENLKLLCTHILQPVRDRFERVVSVSSGYRSEELCLAIGSKITSQHAKGQAADFEIYGLSNQELANYIKENLDYDQLILEYWKKEDPNSGWVHCSYNININRKQYLKAYKENGRTKYEQIF